MTGKNIAVLIGINEYQDNVNLPKLNYAEKDAKDLYGVLTQSQNRIFSKENITLICGQEASTDKIREALFTNVVHKPTSEDTVLVYFSGHGFILGDRPKRAYLGTSDVCISTLAYKNQRAGLRMDELHEDVFMSSPAKYVLFILDSCHSGAFFSSSLKGSKGSVDRQETYDSLVDKSFFSSKEGRIAIVSSPAELPSYESSDFENSLFTYYLLEGLRGKAVEKENKEVSLDSLMTYVRNHMPSEQIPGRYGHDFGRIILSKFNTSAELNQGTEAFSFETTNKRFSQKKISEVIPLGNPLDVFADLLERLMMCLKDQEKVKGRDIQSGILEAIKSAFNADLVATFRKSGDEWVIRSRSSISSDSSDTREEKDFSSLISKIGFVVNVGENSEILFSKSNYGVSYSYQEDSVGKKLIILPLQVKNTSDLMVLYGLPDKEGEFQDLHGRMLSSVYTLTRELTKIDLEEIESGIIDSLKKHHKFLPSRLYIRRKELFWRRLQKMVVKFEPVLYLHPKYLYIDSWEALARIPSSDRAPINLFETAENWGDEFLIELDTYFLRQAVEKYSQSMSEIAGMRRAEDMRELSVNVYPESLMRNAYYRELKNVLRDIQPDKLVLEISEKTPSQNLYDAHENAFRNRLEDYIRNFGIAFSVDDFGVDHSSIQRLSKLNPLHVKVDRDILLQGALESTLLFIKDLLIRRYLRAPKIIVEGIDQESPLSLGQLYQMGVSYVQGHIVSLSSEEPFRLTNDMRDQLRRLITDT